MSNVGKHNRLKLMRFYLVGPMDYDREAGRPWRVEMTDWLKQRKGLPIDPYHKPLLQIHKEAMEDDDRYEERNEIIDKLSKQPYNTQLREELRAIMKPIVHTDLRIVDHADVLVVNLDVEKRPCGTFDETFTGTDQNKPIIVHCPQGVSEIYPWMWGRLPHELFFDKWDDVYSYLDHIDTSPDDKIDLLGRWKFFDLEPLIKEVLEWPE